MKVLVLGILVLTLSLSWGCKKELEGENGEAPLRFQVLFDEKPGLDEGDTVYIKGFEVGEVESITLGERVVVRAVVAYKHKSRVRVRSFGKARLTGGLEMVVLQESSDAAPQNHIFEGADNAVEEFKLRAEVETDEALARGKQLLDDGKAAAKELAKDGVEASKEAGKAAAEKGKAAYKAVRDSGAVNKSKEAVEKGAGVVKDKLQDLLD